MTASLRELQQAFAAAILDDAVDVCASLDPGRFGAERHLQIYRNNTLVGLTEALSAVFPVVQRLVGEGFFAYVADCYLRAHPPRSGNLHDYGNSFPAFLAGFEPARDHTYLPDVAWLEWCWHEAFHAADALPLAPQRLSAVPRERHGDLRFILHPSARLIESVYPILRIWQANQEGSSDDAAVDLAGGDTRLLVLRPMLEVEIETISAGDYALLSALAGNGTFAGACHEALCREPGYDLVGRLGHFVQRVAITDFSLD